MNHPSCLVLFTITFLFTWVIITFILFKDKNDKLSEKSIEFCIAMVLLALCAAITMCWMIYDSCLEFEDDQNVNVKTEEDEDIEDCQYNEKIKVKGKNQDSSSVRLTITSHYDSGIDTDEEGRNIPAASQGNQVIESQDIVPIMTNDKLINDYKTEGGYFIFIPLPNEELSKIDVTSNIVKLRCERNVSRECYIYITKVMDHCLRK